MKKQISAFTLESIKRKKENGEELNLFLEQLKKEMILNDVYYKKAKFQCFDSGLFTYGYSNHSEFFEFSFICDDTLLDKMTIKELLELKRIEYFNSNIYYKKTMELLGGSNYTKNIELEENKELYEVLTKGIDESHLTNGIYISDGIYLRSDGTFTDGD